jgi:hypothetical protein
MISASAFGDERLPLLAKGEVFLLYNDKDMQSLQEWFNRKLEILKSKNLHIKDEYVIPIYSFYLKMKNEYSEYYLDNWDEKYKEFYEKNFKK